RTVLPHQLLRAVAARIEAHAPGAHRELVAVDAADPKVADPTPAALHQPDVLTRPSIRRDVRGSGWRGRLARCRVLQDTHHPHPPTALSGCSAFGGSEGARAGASIGGARPPCPAPEPTAITAACESRCFVCGPRLQCGRPAVLDPLPGVAQHVVQAERIGPEA